VIGEGPLVFVSGQTPTDANGATIGVGDLTTQTAEALRNLERAVQAAGSTIDHVLKVTYYVVAPDAAALKAFEDGFAVAAGWGVRLPLNNAATLARVDGLMNDEWLVEIDAIALTGDRSAA
jgi:enamine deaminase RidA (YjgF/YER057c/UK114 family)